jgi:hypothetical protein
MSPVQKTALLAVNWLALFVIVLQLFSAIFTTIIFGGAE